MIKDEKAYRILVVEDNPGDFVIVEHYLTEQIANPVIVQANDFQEASSILAHNLFDVILLDLSLPDQSGQQLIDKMLEVASACPIIILTGFADIDFSIKSISRGIMDYLLKDDLNAAVIYKSIIYAIGRRKATLDIKESEKRYSDIFHLSPQPMWVADPETNRFFQVNKATTDLYGYTEQEFMKMTLMNLTPEEEVLTANESSKENETPDSSVHIGLYIHCKKSGELIEVEIHSRPISIDNRMFRLVIANDVTEKNQHEQNIIKAILKTQEDERNEIGGELHDNVCQILATSQIRLSMLKEYVAPEGISMLNQCRDNIVLASKEIRKLSHILAPAINDFATLEEEFQNVLNAFNIDGRYSISLDFDDNVRQYELDVSAKQHLYRILQEQLVNILKHADCTAIRVRGFIQDDKLQISISDNGIGFRVDAAKKGIGLANMQRRVDLLSGKFRIESSPEHGCEILIGVPLNHLT